MRLSPLQDLHHDGCEENGWGGDQVCQILPGEMGKWLRWVDRLRIRLACIRLGLIPEQP